jgi:hypothetical protein
LKLHHLRGQCEVERHRFSETYGNAAAPGLPVAHRSSGNVIIADPQKSGRVDAPVVRRERAFSVGFHVTQRHGGARNRLPGRIGDGSADHSGGCLGLSVEPVGQRCGGEAKKQCQ